jgi:hypothetical protein
MSTRFGRSWKVTVDGLDVTPLHFDFKVLRTIKAEPNKCLLTLINLSQDHRAQLAKRNQPTSGSKLQGVSVQIEAGYGKDTSVIFSGDLSTVSSKLEGVDWKTTLTGADGGRAWREARINTQFTKGTPYGTALKQVCDAMGVGIGNAANFTAQAQIATASSLLPFSMTASGSAAKALTQIVDSMRVPDSKGGTAGVTWSIQSGALQLLQKGQPLNLAAIDVTPTSGLVGSPASSIDSTVSLGNPQASVPGAKSKKPSKPKDPGIVKWRMLMDVGAVPARKVTLKSNEFNGGYALTEVLTSGQSYAQDWYNDCVGRLYT